MTRAGVLDTIDAILSAVATPTFQIVVRGEPLSIPSGDRVAAFWYSGDTTQSETLGDVQIEELFTVRCYWRAALATDVRENVELEIWNANRAIQAGLRADSQLSGHCSDLKIDEATAGWAEVGGAWYRAITIPLRVWVMESESIAP